MIAFDADVLIYAASTDHVLGRRIRPLFEAEVGGIVGTGSVLLLPEVLAKPLRAAAGSAETAVLLALLSRLQLQPVDDSAARLATALAASYGLRAADAVHLAAAVTAGADHFLTNNRRDFPRTIREVDVLYPDDLPGA